jgi:hypothetical protein
MKQKHRFFLRLGLLSLLISTFMLLAAHAPAQATVFPLEIINIKPAGTGSPAIPSTNRIFRAYPGIEYNIRAAVVGGQYPYTFNLSNAPSGMTINSATGEIKWPNPQANSGVITLSVTDSENKTVSSTWTITVTSSTNDFIFINSAYSGTQTGSITQPYSSLAAMLASQANNNKIVYFREGTYQLVTYNNRSDRPHEMDLGTSPRTWLEYPGETAILQGNSGTGQANRMTIWNHFYFDGLTFRDMVDFGILTGGEAHYKTIRRCIFDGLVPSDNTNNNYGFFHNVAGTVGYYATIQDSEFTDWVNSSAIGSLYDEHKMLIENNYIHGQRTSSTYSGIGTTVGISPKINTDYLTVRGNKVTMSTGEVMGGSANGLFHSTDNVEICFNLFYKTSERGGHKFDMYEGLNGRTYYWRNTLIGDLVIKNGGGPYYVNNNVISNPNTAVPGNIDYITNFIGRNVATFTSTVSITNNLTNTSASALIDSGNEYKLVSAHSASVGSRGWQLSNGSTPMQLGSTPLTTPPAETIPAPLLINIQPK